MYQGLPFFLKPYTYKTRSGDLVVPDPFGRFWTILDLFGSTGNHSVYLYPSIWTSVFWTSLFGPVNLDLSIWSQLFGPVSLDPSIWPHLFGPVYLDLSICILFLGPVYLDPSIWTCLFGPVYLDLPIWTL